MNHYAPVWVTIIVVTIGFLPAQESATPVDEFQTRLSGTIRNVVETGTHPEMRWSKFPYYKDELEKIYAPLNFGLFWFNRDGVKPLARSVIAELGMAAENGLDHTAYDAAMLAGILARLNRNEVREPEALALFDTALTMGLLRYISDLHIGRINPKNLHFGLSIEEKKYDLAAGFQNFTDNTDMRTLIHLVQPELPVYHRLKTLLPRYRALAADPRFQPLPVVQPVLRPGETYSALGQLSQLLVAVGDLPESEWDRQLTEGIYEGPVVDGVKRFQLRHGLETDGILGPATFKAINVPFSHRLRSITMALERMRWLPDLNNKPFIVVNIPGFHLFAFEKGQLGAPALEMNVIVGSAINKTQTPIFSDRMTYLDFNPYWNVPYSIARIEMLPKIRNDPGYLEKSDLELVAEFGNNVKAIPVTSEAIANIATGKTLIRQRPGPRNALGLVKFIFPNAHNVYLHSTPQQQLFAESRRDFSHGCIRVEKPAALAEWVLRNHNDWDLARINTTMDGGRPQRVNLKEPLPVFIFYTSVVARGTEVYFYPDIYGHDEKLERALATGYPYDP